MAKRNFLTTFCAHADIAFILSKQKQNKSKQKNNIDVVLIDDSWYGTSVKWSSDGLLKLENCIVVTRGHYQARKYPRMTFLVHHKLANITWRLEKKQH